MARKENLECHSRESGNPVEKQNVDLSGFPGQARE